MASLVLTMIWCWIFVDRLPFLCWSYWIAACLLLWFWWLVAAPRNCDSYCAYVPWASNEVRAPMTCKARSGAWQNRLWRSGVALSGCRAVTLLSCWNHACNVCILLWLLLGMEWMICLALSLIMAHHRPGHDKLAKLNLHRWRAMHSVVLELFSFLVLAWPGDADEWWLAAYPPSCFTFVYLLS